jgi:hypothetical protein
MIAARLLDAYSQPSMPEVFFEEIISYQARTDLSGVLDGLPAATRWRSHPAIAPSGTAEANRPRFDPWIAPIHSSPTLSTMGKAATASTILTRDGRGIAPRPRRNKLATAPAAAAAYNPRHRPHTGN